MNWQIPAKTFLLGEYAALAGAGAILLTTSPCFETSLKEESLTNAIHPESPAGKWWSRHQSTLANTSFGMSWKDPYHGQGGLGASSAQFLGAYLSSCHVSGIEPNHEALLEYYYESAWSGKGLKPSGYDVLAQSQRGCVYINRQQEIMQSYAWPFEDLAFILVHSGHKLATHHHLQSTTLPNAVDVLANLVEQGKQAFEEKDSAGLLQAVSDYQKELSRLNLTAEPTLRLIEAIKSQLKVLAVKGCGAMGADVLLLIVANTELDTQTDYLNTKGWMVLADNRMLYQGQELIKKKS
jgi:mevalonate kinase